MDVKVKAAVAAGLETTNVSELARELGISRVWLYELRRRYETEGLAGLEARSRRPHSSPGQMPAGVEDEVVRLRKELTDQGADAGAATIRWHLQRSGMKRLPSESAIYRTLKRRGLVEDEPKKRPRSSYKSFEFGLVNECWQIDACDWKLRDGQKVEIINIEDDHSRLSVASQAVSSTTCQTAFETLLAGVSGCGLPALLLSDNDLAFSGKIRGHQVAFEKNLRALGVKPITSTPRHPQTCGKVERFQQTLKKWLRARTRASSLEELQEQLEDFRVFYNHNRPHRSLRRKTPGEVFETHPCTGPQTGTQSEAPAPRVHSLTATADGVIRVLGHSVGLGIEWAHQPVQAISQGLDLAVFTGDQLIRSLTIDPNRYYQPTGKPRGPKPKNDPYC
ncbi:MAG: IS481 family transposase [Acidimicrobiia bacterium]